MNIEKGVPIPNKTRSGVIYDIARSMNDGDSVVVSLSRVQALRSRLMEVSGLHAISRKEGDMYRVWAVKK